MRGRQRLRGFAVFLGCQPWFPWLRVTSCAIRNVTQSGSPQGAAEGGERVERTCKKR